MSRDYKYAQHFLRSPRLVAELIGHSNIRKNDLVYDLGAGSGVISSVLANRCKKVVAVEIEPNALKNLRRNLGNILNVDIVERDILSVEPPAEPYKIFANIPFSLSAEIVRKFTETNRPPKAIYLITQRQFCPFTSFLLTADSALGAARCRFQLGMISRMPCTRLIARSR